MSMGSTAIPLLQQLNENSIIILASGSPRRKELLTLMGLTNFSILKSDFEEDLDHLKFPTAAEYCMETAICKAKDIVLKVENPRIGTILIGSDTIVEINGKILEKPVDEIDAYNMISKLSGSTHVVHTSVIIFSNGRFDKSDNNLNAPLLLTAKFVESTAVTFALLSEEDKKAYIDSREGFDKAGGYGIQGLGGQMVEKIDGCYFNVMGLPLNKLSKTLAQLYGSNQI
jgi:septum formation protein